MSRSPAPGVPYGQAPPMQPGGANPYLQQGMATMSIQPGRPQTAPVASNAVGMRLFDSMQGKSAGPGKVGWAEFAAEWGKIGWNQQIAAQMWADCDKNKSGAVTKDEFIAFASRPDLAPHISKAEAALPPPAVQPFHPAPAQPIMPAQPGPAVGGQPQKCPMCQGKGNFDTWDKPCEAGNMHKKMACPLCNARCFFPGAASFAACPKCGGKGGFDTWNRPCLKTNMHHKTVCVVCHGKAFLGSVAPAMPVHPVQPAMPMHPVAAPTHPGPPMPVQPAIPAQPAAPRVLGDKLFATMQGKSAGPGKVGWAEFAAEWGKIGWNQQIAAQMWADCDKNKSGAVTRDEFVVFVGKPELQAYVKKHEDMLPEPPRPVMPAPATFAPPQQASPYAPPGQPNQAPPQQVHPAGFNLFHHIDGKGGVKDGKLEWGEFLPMIKSIGWDEQTATRMWYDADKNRDGKLTKDEFLAFCATQGVHQHIVNMEQKLFGASGGAPPQQNAPPPFSFGQLRRRLTQGAAGSVRAEDAVEYAKLGSMPVAGHGYLVLELVAAPIYKHYLKELEGTGGAKAQAMSAKAATTELLVEGQTGLKTFFKGRHTLVRAWYGDASTKFVRNGKDVTQLVRTKLAAGGPAAVQASNGTFGDPCPGRAKALIVEFKAAAAAVTAVKADSLELLGEGQTGLKTFQQGRHTLVRAWYGDPRTKFVRNGKDVTQLVRTKLAAGGPAAVQASNGTFGDPCPGVAKALCVEFGAAPGSRTAAGTVPGSECCGKVVRVGAGVTGFRVGQTVHCSGQSDGSWSEFFLARADTCTAADPHIAADDLAQMLTKPSVAYALAFERLKLTKGQWVLVTAPGSTVAHCLIQMCKAKGVKTICLIRAPERSLRAEQFRRLGADLIVSMQHSPEECTDAIARAVGPGGVRFAADACGGSTLERFVLPAMARGGTVVVYKLLEQAGNLGVNGRLLLDKQLTVGGFSGKTFFRHADAATAKRVKHGVMAMFAAKQVTMPATVKIPLSMYKEAVTQSRQSCSSNESKTRILLVKG